MLYGDAESDVPILLRGVEGIKAYLGFHLGKSSWLEIDQEFVAGLVCAIDDRDEARMGTEGNEDGSSDPSLVPGYTIVGLVIPMLREIYLLEDVGTGAHYGMDRLRFLAAIPAHSSVRLGAKLRSVEPAGEMWQLALECRMECDATKEPVLEADVLYRFQSLSHTKVPQLALCKSE